MNKSFIINNYKPEEQHEELFTYWLAKSMKDGSVDKMIEMMDDEGDKQRGKSILKELNYDIERETKERNDRGRNSSMGESDTFQSDNAQMGSRARGGSTFFHTAPDSPPDSSNPADTARRIAYEERKRREKIPNQPSPKLYDETMHSTYPEKRRTMFSVAPSPYDTVSGADQKIVYGNAVRKGSFSWHEAWGDTSLRRTHKNQ